VSTAPKSEPETRTAPAGTAMAMAVAAMVFTAALWGPAGLHTPSEPFEIDPDEGGNLMKALVIADGHAPWSDQPPLMPWLWSLVDDVGQARLLTALIVTLGVAGLAGLTSRRVSRARDAAIVGLVVGAACAAWPGMLVAARALLIGLPALAFSTWAAWMANRSGRGAWLAAPLAAAAVASKLWGLVPLAAALLALSVHPPSSGRGRVALVLGGVVGGAVALVAGGASVVVVHLEARTSLEGVGASLGAALAPAVGLLLPAALSAPWLVRQGAPGLQAALTLVLACAFVALQTPRWWHHGLIVGWAVAAVLGVVVASALVTPRRAAKLVVVVAVAVVVVVLGFAWSTAAGVLRRMLPAATPSPVALPCGPQAVATSLAAMPAGIVITDRPMVAARAGHRAPPSLAVISLKRRAAGLDGDTLEREIDAALAAGTLRAVYLERFPWPGIDVERTGLEQVVCPGSVIFSRARVPVPPVAP
jgi:hypothetical protein